MTDVKGADIRQLLEKICAMRKAQADYSFQQKIVVLIINLLFSTSFPTKPLRIVEKTAMLLFYKKLTSSDGYRQIVSCVEQLTFQFDQILVDPGFQMAIADIFLSFASEEIPHFAFLPLLGIGSLPGGFFRQINLPGHHSLLESQLRPRRDHHTDGVRTDERIEAAKHSSNAVSQKMAKDNLHCTMCISANLDCLPSH